MSSSEKKKSANEEKHAEHVHSALIVFSTLLEAGRTLLKGAMLSYRLPWHGSPSHVIKKSPMCSAFYGLQNRASWCDLVFPVSLKQRDSHPGNVATTRSRTPSLSLPNTLAGSRHCRCRSQKTSQVKVSWALFFPVTKGENQLYIHRSFENDKVIWWFHMFYYDCIFLFFIFLITIPTSSLIEIWSFIQTDFMKITISSN